MSVDIRAAKNINYPRHARRHAKKRSSSRSQAQNLGGALSCLFMAAVNYLAVIPSYYATRSCPANASLSDGSICSVPYLYPIYPLGLAICLTVLAVISLAVFAISRSRPRGIHRRFHSESARGAAHKYRNESRCTNPDIVISKEINNMLGAAIRHHI
jgi:hypothetical protein